MTESLDLFTNVEPSSLSNLSVILAYQLFDQLSVVKQDDW